MTFRLPERDTRFALPIIHPITGETVSAETLYNTACDGMGYVVRDYIGDLVFDNLDYSGIYDEGLLWNAVNAWRDDVVAQLTAAGLMS